MTQTNGLEQIIRRIEDHQIRLDEARGERLFVFDARAEQILEKKPLFTLGKDLRFLVVATEGLARCSGPTFVYDHELSGRSFELDLPYEVSCRAGGAETLALSFGRHNNAQHRLDQLISLWAQKFRQKTREQGAGPLDGFESFRNSLRTFLAEQAREYGLEIDVAVRLKGAEALKVHEVAPGPFAVSVSDSIPQVTVDLEVSLGVHPDHILEALLHVAKREYLSEQVVTWTKSLLAEGTTLDDLHRHVKDRVVPRLRAHLDQKLARYGRKVDHLEFGPTVAWGEEAGAKEIDYSVNCKIKDTDDRILVKNQLLLDLEDLGKWKESGLRDLEQWCETKLAPVVRGALFERTYVDVLLKFDEVQRNIKSRVRAEAEQVGYSAQHHVLRPDLPPLELREGFSLEVASEFATKTTEVRIPLEIVVHGSIPDLEQIRSLLSPRTDLCREMEKLVEREVAKVIHGTSANRFYTQFVRSMEPEIQPVEEELAEAVATRLEQRFAVASPRVVVKRGKTPLDERLLALCRGHHIFTVMITPNEIADGREDVPFHVQFEVKGPMDWSTFQLKGYETAEEEIEGIKEVLGAALKTALSSVRMELLRYRDFEALKLIRKNIAAPAIRSVGEVFGLVVNIINFRRLPTFSESALGDAEKKLVEARVSGNVERTQMQIAAKRDKYEGLLSLRGSLTKGSYDKYDPELQDVEEEIARLEDDLVDIKPAFAPADPPVAGTLPEFDFSSYGDTPRLSSWTPKALEVGEEQDET